MKQFRLAALLLCSVISSGCYAVVQGNPANLNNPAVHVALPAAIALAVIFVAIGVAVALQTENSDRRKAALGISVGATIVFLLLVG